METTFQEELKAGLHAFLEEQKSRYPQRDLLKIDLHCHDHNSDVPDELIGRILNVSETWLPSERLFNELKANGCNAFTVTNHNNARSCYELQDKGYDLLTGCEFSCMTPDYHIGIHVLAYGFTPEQEARMNKLRRNVYLFQEYALKEAIPTVWAHPLYHYSAKTPPPMEFFHKLGLIFERFEALNGQRDTWQNMLVKDWITGLTPDKIDHFARRMDIDPAAYCSDPYRKALTGGSDSHIGIFAGLTGTYLHVDRLAERLQAQAPSALALEALRNGRMIPYGSHQNTEKLTIAFLDYVSQVALNYKDPGLVRLLLHRGTASEKILSFLISNFFLEVQHHKTTTSFFRLFHESIMGKSPSLLKKIALKPSYKPVFDEIAGIAKAHRSRSQTLVDDYNRSIHSINEKLNEILFARINKKIDRIDRNGFPQAGTIENLLVALDLPTGIRSYLASGATGSEAVNLAAFLDSLSFPFFAVALILAAHFASARALFHTRPFLREFARHTGRYDHPRRALWLTDTFGDPNGVSTALQSIYQKIKDDNLPVDILVCSRHVEPGERLIVMPPLCEFPAPFYSDQPIRIPNLLDLHKLFHEREYDRVICSTEGMMGLMALYLKHAYSVEASFYVHTDWATFARKTLNFDIRNLNRIRRMLRAFYGAFDQVFVLNAEQQQQFAANGMKLRPGTVKLTSHWVDPLFSPRATTRRDAFGLRDETPLLLYAGRLSAEKGVMELPLLYRAVQERHEGLQLAIAGSGPLAGDLRRELPGAVFFDWMDRDRLAQLYSCADMLVFPSRFDTFGCVVLEALSCGLPVVAYNAKGPKDIILHRRNGYLVNSLKDMTAAILTYLADKDLHPHFRKAAIRRAADYKATDIMHDFLRQTGLA
jgi:glycosyltransferase involved in cell wall biosynthesis/predicted metal-dependent phosphoesterase TrpH